MKLRKSIGYSYPTSPNAETLGSHGYHVNQSILREDGSWSPEYLPVGCEVFATKDNPDLLAIFEETEGDICPMYLYVQSRNLQVSA
jgi:hypothetical protein